MMNDIILSNQLRLESLPNELFLEIFQYVDPMDLRCFKGLTKRIDQIIQILKVNIVVQYQADEELDFLSSFAPIQIIRLELRDYWSSLDFTTMIELRSLKLDCTYLSTEQLDQITKITLPALERLCIEDVTYDLRVPLLYAIFDGEHFPLLKICQLKFRHLYNMDIDEEKLSSNKNIIRSLTLDRWEWAEFGTLLHQLPHLRRLETNFEEANTIIVGSIQPHLLLNHLRITLKDPSDDLGKLLKWTPKLTRLRVRGNLGGNLVIDGFEKMAGFLSTLVPHLQRFDCELYCYGSYSQEKYIQENECIIRQLHPLFKGIQCLFGREQNQCYTSDMTTYPNDNDYESIRHPASFSWDNTDYDDDDSSDGRDEYESDNDDNGFIDYGLGYRENYRRNYGSSPWSGNND